METEISIAKVILSLLLVIGLIGLCALVLKWLSDKSLIMRQMGGDKRLKLLEVLVLDHKHKMFLVAQDEREFSVISNGTDIHIVDQK